MLHISSLVPETLESLHLAIDGVLDRESSGPSALAEDALDVDRHPAGGRTGGKSLQIPLRAVEGARTGRPSIQLTQHWLQVDPLRNTARCSAVQMTAVVAQRALDVRAKDARYIPSIPERPEER